MATVETLTLSEAGYILDRSPAALNKAVDTGVIRARQRRVGKAVQRLIGPAELRFLLLSEKLEGDLTPAGRRRLYEAVRRLSADAHRVALGEVILDLARIDEDLKSRLRRLEAVRKWVDAGDDEQGPVMKGTRIPVYMVAALARGQTMEEILEDFPSLTREGIWLDLYDLSDTVRLRSADAESFPVAPMPKDPRPGCRPWVKPSPLDSLR